MKVEFIEMKDEHLDKVLDIYNYYVLNTTSTFHAHKLSLEEMRELVFFNNPKYKTFVIMCEDYVSGYVSLKQHKTREAYDHTAEVAVYLNKDSIGKGLGGLAVKYIEEYAKSKGLHVLIASICGQNGASIRLFTGNGFFKCAHYREVGKKFEQTLDVVAYQKILD